MFRLFVSIIMQNIYTRHFFPAILLALSNVYLWWKSYILSESIVNAKAYDYSSNNKYQNLLFVLIWCH
jgi:hypothetical protein